MVLVLLGFCMICFVVYYFAAFSQKEEAKMAIKPEEVTPDNVHNAFNEDELKKEFLVFFKEVYRCFSTGKLTTVSTKVSDDLLKSLEQSVRSRDEDNFVHKFSGEPLCTIQNITVDKDNVVSIRTEFRSEQIISVPDMEDITDNVVDFFVFQKSLNNKGEAWKLVQMG